MLRRVPALCLVLLVCLVSCNKRPSGILSEKETVDLLADLQIAEAYSNNYTGQERLDREALIEGVLKSHGVTHAELDSTLSYYGKNLDEYYKLYDKISVRIDEKSGKLYAGNTNESADNIWPYGPHTYIFEREATNGLMFSIDAAGIEPGEKLEWKLKLNKELNAEALLGMEFEDGSSIVSKKSTGGASRNFTISLQTDTIRIGKRIFGYLNVPPSDMPLWLDSISLIKQPLDTLTYSEIRMHRNIFKPRVRPAKVEKDTTQNNEEAPLP